MGGFTKLKSSIIHSTIWQEPDHIRILWVTMLAMKNADGIVEASVPGLARAAVISVEQCEDGLRRLMSPDKYSRSKEHDGRRIAEIDGGWTILNHEKHRGPTSTEKVRAWREKKRNETECNRVQPVQPVTSVTSGCATSETASDTDPDPDTDKDKDKKNVEPRTRARTKTTRATQLPDDWRPNETHYTMASELGIQIAPQVAHFRDHHTAKGSVFKDWDAAFRTWLRNSTRFGGQKVQPDFASAAREWIDEREGR